MIRTAADTANMTSEVEQAWQDLIDRYRAAIKATIRRQLGPRDDLGDIADEIFAELYRNDTLTRIDSKQGKFRCYLQGFIRRHLLAFRRKERGLSAVDLTEDDVGAEVVTADVEEREEADWAAAVLKVALDRLAKTKPRDARLIRAAYGVFGEWATPRVELAATFDMSVNNLNVALNRARHALRETLHDELRETVANPESFEEELHLLRIRLLGAQLSLLRDLDGETGEADAQ